MAQEQPAQVPALLASGWLAEAQEQALDFGHSLDREIAFLFVHGVLHVLGFDHITKAQEKDMFSRQKLVLDAAGVSR